MKTAILFLYLHLILSQLFSMGETKTGRGGGRSEFVFFIKFLFYFFLQGKGGKKCSKAVKVLTL